MIKINREIKITYIEKPRCKLIIKRGIKSVDYFSYCEEIGCEIWEELEKITAPLDKPVFVTLPDFMMKEGMSKVGVGVEVPLDFSGEVPCGCDVIELGAHAMAMFQGQPYEDENEYGIAHEELYAAMRNYDPKSDGYRYAYEMYPEFQYSASAKYGVKALKPVVKI